jgi:maltose alpha-D-glucosyltransferase/alpha-amylase
LFLRNHDELTLEMVTDEDRDYMYKVYASDPKARLNLGIRRRLTPLLGGQPAQNRAAQRVAFFSCPARRLSIMATRSAWATTSISAIGTACARRCKWSADRNAGFSRANPQRLYLPIIIDPEHHYEAINVEAQQQN